MNCIICGEVRTSFNCSKCFAFSVNEQLNGYNINGNIYNYIYFDYELECFIIIDPNGKHSRIKLEKNNFENLTPIEQYNIYKKISENIVFY